MTGSTEVVGQSTGKTSLLIRRIIAYTVLIVLVFISLLPLLVHSPSLSVFLSICLCVKNPCLFCSAKGLSRTMLFQTTFSSVEFCICIIRLPYLDHVTVLPLPNMCSPQDIAVLYQPEHYNCQILRRSNSPPLYYILNIL